MRENRQSGSEGGGTGNSTGPPYPYVRPWAHTFREVRILFRHALSGLKPKVTASPRGDVESNRRRETSPQADELDSA